MDGKTAAQAIEVVGKHAEAMLTELRSLIVEAGSERGTASSTNGSLDTSWTEIQRLAGQTYQWPEKNGGLEEYDPFVVYEGGGLVLAVAPLTNNREREQTWVFKMGEDLETKRPLTPFVAADDYADSREMVSLIRGKGETGREMFGPGDQLPSSYEDMRIELYSDRKKGGYNRLCVVAQRDDHETMLRHCAAQVRLRRL